MRNSDGGSYPWFGGATSIARNCLLCAAVVTAFVAAAWAAEPVGLQAQLETATALHRRADYAHSIPLLRQILAASPHNYTANLLLGEDLLRSGNPHEAITPLQAAAEARRADSAVEAFVAEAATALGDFALVAEAMQSAVSRSGGTEQSLLSWGDYCIDRFRELEMHLRTTKRGEAMELRVEAWSHLDASPERRAMLEQSAAADPEQPGIWADLGIAQLGLGEREAARASLGEALGRERDASATVHLAALVAAAIGDWNGAAEDLSALGAHSPAELRGALAEWPAALRPPPDLTGPLWDCVRNASSACLLAEVQPQSGQRSSVAALYAEGRWEQLQARPLSSSPSPAELLWHGVAFAKTEECPKAIPLLERGLSADKLVAGFWLEFCFANEIAGVEARFAEQKNDPARHELIGDRHLWLRFDFASARQEYVEALKTRRGDAALLARLAEASIKLGDTEGARKAALGALAVNPRQSSALHSLAQAAMNERNYGDALTWLKKLAAVEPRSAWVRVELGVAFGQTGNPAEAVHYLGPALDAGYPDHKGSLHAQLAAALRKLGRGDEARQAAAEAARLANAALNATDQGAGDVHQ